MKKIVMIAAAVWLVAACSPKEEYSVAPSVQKFYATIEQGTRTYTDGSGVYWINDSDDKDEISVFYKNSTNVEYVYDGEDGADQGAFIPASSAAEAGTEFDYVYAIYPYYDFNAIWGEGELYAYITPQQYYCEDSFGIYGMNPMAAVSEDENLKFKNLAGYLKLSLIGDDSTAISKILVSSNNDEYIAGDLLVEIAPDEAPEVSVYPDLGYANTAVQVNFSTAQKPVYLDASTPVDVWICLAPGTIQSGITVTVTGENNAEFTYTSTKPLTIKRAVYTATAPLEVVFGDVDPLIANYTVDDFYDDGALSNRRDWLGKWDYYAVDYYSSAGVREYQGVVGIDISPTATEGPDDNGNYDEYVLVDGLFPNAVDDGAYYGYDLGTCVYEMDVYAGILYCSSETTYDEKCSVYFYSKGQDNMFSGASFVSAFIPVADGFYACVDLYYGASYNFTGLVVYQEYVWDAMYDLLLVDQSVSSPTNGISEEIEEAISEAKATFAACAKEASHIPFANKKAFVKATIDSYNAKYVESKRSAESSFPVRKSAK